MKLAGKVLPPKFRGSRLIMPFSLFAHILTINLTLYLLTPDTYLNIFAAISYNLIWLITSLGLNFYTIERKERFYTKFKKFLKHFLIFSLAYFAVFGFLRMDFNPQYQVFVLIFLFSLLIFYRWFFFSVRRLYRVEGGNYVNVVVIGKDRNYESVIKIFKEPDFGYRYKGFFHKTEEKHTHYLGRIEDSFAYINSNHIDEVYCTVSQLTNCEIYKLINFCDNNFKKIKLIPDNREIFTRAMDVELFKNLPIINIRNSPLERNYAKYGKRVFDIVFSSLVIILILFWLIPLLFVLQKIESKGPLFFKQIRHGYNKKPFYCYKFRSMAVNQQANLKMCTRKDPRITKLGKFLRKTSIDELPQFINVFLGDMSVVGPRPHMESHTEQFSSSIDKYLVRHFAKPGITGLAQIKGYRGEISRKSDIINRTRLDIFYLEKWTALMDFLIIFHTIRNAINGEIKAF